MTSNPPPDLNRGQSAALVLISNIGDLLLLEPAIRYLNHSGITLDLYCSAETAMVWENDSRLRRVIPIPSRNTRYRGAEERPQPLPKERYDHLFDFRPTGRGVKLALRLRVRHRHTWRQDRASRFFYPFIYRHRVDIPQCEMRRDQYYLELLGLRGLDASQWLSARMTIPTDELAVFQNKHPQFQTVPQRNLVVLQPTARWERKLWNEGDWREIIAYLKKQYQAECVLVSGPSSQEQEMLQRIGDGLVSAESVFAGNLSWRELGCAFALANGFVGLDSAPYHLAAMLGTPLVVLFGETNENEWGPVLPRQALVKAPLEEGRHCIKKLPVSKVIEALDSVLFN